MSYKLDPNYFHSTLHIAKLERPVCAQISKKLVSS